VGGFNPQKTGNFLKEYQKDPIERLKMSSSHSVLKKLVFWRQSEDLTRGQIHRHVHPNSYSMNLVTLFEDDRLLVVSETFNTPVQPTRLLKWTNGREKYKLDTHI
jgi:hypothetical protein